MNRRAGSAGKFQPFRVGGKDLLTSVAAQPGARFPERFKKDLLKLIPDIDLSNAVLIDDVANFLIAGQEGNLLWLQQTFDDVPKFERLNQYEKLEYVPPTRRAWALERNKLSWALGVILEARNSSRRVKGSTFLEQLKSLTHDSKAVN